MTTTTTPKPGDRVSAGAVAVVPEADFDWYFRLEDVEIVSEPTTVPASDLNPGDLVRVTLTATVIHESDSDGDVYIETLDGAEFYAGSNGETFERITPAPATFKVGDLVKDSDGEPAVVVSLDDEDGCDYTVLGLAGNSRYGDTFGQDADELTAA